MSVPPRSQRQVDVYVGLLMLLYGLVAQLFLLPVQFYLKDNLHLGPQAVALFVFLIGIPTYVAFLFGSLRDRWRPRVGGDRAYLMGAGLLSAVGYLYLANSRVTYTHLLVALLFLMAGAQMVATVIQAVSAAAAQRDGTTGRLSAVYWIGYNLPVALAALAGGWLTSHATPHRTFLLLAGISVVIALLSLWRPRPVYDGLPERPWLAEGGQHALARLVRHRSLWPAVLVNGMWSFGLCFGTPAQYYLTDRTHVSPALSPEQYGLWLTLFSVAFLPTTALYGLVSRHWPLSLSLRAGTGLAVFQTVLFLLIHTPGTAYAAAVVGGLCGGFVNGAYWDLLMRSAPKGLEGTAMTMGAAAVLASAAGTSLLGAVVYAHGGFALTVWLTTLVYALIFPVILRVPRSVTATHDATDARETQVKAAPEAMGA